MRCFGYCSITSRSDQTSLRLAAVAGVIPLAEFERSMRQSLVHVALVVSDYDEAIDFYTNTLDFELVEDTHIPEQDKRWVLISPAGGSGSEILLARASSQEQRDTIGNQTGGRVFLFLSTDDFWRDYHRYLERGVEFVREPAEHEYGTVAVFRDLYGNLWDLLERRNAHRYSQKDV